MKKFVAELGAALICADQGNKPAIPADHALFIASWLVFLKKDKRAI